MSHAVKDSITSARLSLRVDGEPHFLVALDSGAHVKRMGHSALARRQTHVAAGELPGAFQSFLESVPEAILDRAGTYEDPGTTGSRCQWRIEFDSGFGPVRFDLTYHAGSAGLPPAMASLVERAESLTDDWYSEQLPAEEPTPVEPDPAAAQAPSGSDTPPPAGVAATPEVATKGVMTIQDYLSFEGRLGRMDYLMMYVVPLGILGFVAGFADGLAGLANEAGIGPMGSVATLISIWPGMAGWAKRLHDFDMSLWIVPKVAVASIAIIVVGAALNPLLAILSAAIGGLAFFALMIATYFWPGTKGPNKFGPPTAF